MVNSYKDMQACFAFKYQMYVTGRNTKLFQGKAYAYLI